MEKEQELGKYILPTAAGVFHLACQKREETSASLLFSKIFEKKRLVKLTDEEIQKIMGLTDSEFAKEMEAIYAMGWIEEFDEPLELPDGSLEVILPQLISALSSEKEALISDEHGFCLFSIGIPEEDMEALAVMTADLAAIYSKYESVYGHEILPSQAWSMVDASGNCQMGVWPIHLGEQNFNLLIRGIPVFNHPNFVIVAWLLYNRYCI